MTVHNTTQHKPQREATQHPLNAKAKASSQHLTELAAVLILLSFLIQTRKVRFLVIRSSFAVECFVGVATGLDPELHSRWLAPVYWKGMQVG